MGLGRSLCCDCAQREDIGALCDLTLCASGHNIVRSRKKQILRILRAASEQERYLLSDPLEEKLNGAESFQYNHYYVQSEWEGGQYEVREVMRQ